MSLAKGVAILTIAMLLVGVWFRTGVRARGPTADSTSMVVGAVFSALVLLASLYVILSKKYGDAEQKWAYGSTGAVLGFWLGG